MIQYHGLCHGSMLWLNIVTYVINKGIFVINNKVLWNFMRL